MLVRDALERSIVLWDWLAANPGEGKQAALMACFPHEPRPLYGCFLCELTKYYGEFDQHTARADCTKCPVWPVTDSPDTQCCEAEGSPYQAWVDHHRDAGAARAVANLCRKALEGL